MTLEKLSLLIAGFLAGLGCAKPPTVEEIQKYLERVQSGELKCFFCKFTGLWDKLSYKLEIEIRDGSWNVVLLTNGVSIMEGSSRAYLLQQQMNPGKQS